MIQANKPSPKMRVTWGQACLLYISARIAVLGATVPTISSAPYPNRDLWLVPLLVVPVTLLIGNIAVKLGSFFPRQTLIEYSKTLTGPIIGTLIALLYAWWFIYIAAINLRLSSDFFITAFLPETPISVFVGTLALLAGYTARQGYQVLARGNQILAPLILGLIWLLFFLSIKDLKLTNLTPIMAGGLKPLIINSITPVVLFSDIINVVMVTPYMTNPSQTNKFVKWGVIVGALHSLLIVLVVIALFGIDTAKSLEYPGLSITRQIDIAGFIQRMEVAILLIWLGGMWVRITLGLLWASLALAQGFKLRCYEPLVFPLALLASALTFFLGNNVLEYSRLFHPRFIAPFYLTYSVAIPLILLLLVYIKAHRKSVIGNDSSSKQSRNLAYPRPRNIK